MARGDRRNYQKAPHLSVWSLSSTGGGALRWPSGSTLVRTDGPPPIRAAHPPSLTSGPATHDSTRGRVRLQRVVPAELTAGQFREPHSRVETRVRVDAACHR